jgi:hypothetical protein
LENVTFEAGQTYYLVVDGYAAADAGNFTMCFESACPADLDGDGSLGVSDLMLLLEGYGTQFQVSHLLEFTAVFGDACE